MVDNSSFIYNDIKELKNTFSENGRLMGLDMGTKKIGVAISDVNRIIASPLKVVTRINVKKDIENIIKIIEEFNIISIIIGLPITMQGTEGPNCVLIKDFMKKFLNIYNINIYFHDERFSTAAVNRMLSTTNLTRKKKEKLDDKLAACYILQSFLDQLNYTNVVNFN